MLVLVGGAVEEPPGSPRSSAPSGVPVLHLADDLAPEAALDYAISVEASWVGYPAPRGWLAPAETGGSSRRSRRWPEEVLS